MFLRLSPRGDAGVWELPGSGGRGRSSRSGARERGVRAPALPRELRCATSPADPRPPGLCCARPGSARERAARAPDLPVERPRAPSSVPGRAVRDVPHPPAPAALCGARPGKGQRAPQLCAGKGFARGGESGPDGRLGPPRRSPLFPRVKRRRGRSLTVTADGETERRQTPACKPRPSRAAERAPRRAASAS